MLNFIRRIRKELINEGDLKKYLVYAIGEIFLVMVGILLALQVNTWNQSRLDQQKESKVLVDLYEEFKLNKERIEEKQNYRKAIVPELRKYTTALSEGRADYSSFKTFHSNQYMIGMTNPSNGVMDAMISSGDLALISNRELKYLLADWKDQAGNLYENEQILWDVSLDYNDSFESILPSPIKEWEDLKTKDFEEPFRFLKNNVLYRNKLLGFEGCLGIVVGECEVILASIDEILELLEDEM